MLISAKTSVLLSANGGKFKATDPYSTAENITDSLGRHGRRGAQAHPDHDHYGHTGQFAQQPGRCPRARFTTRSSDFSAYRALLLDSQGQCSISESSNNFVGGITLRQDFRGYDDDHRLQPVTGTTLERDLSGLGQFSA